MLGFLLIFIISFVVIYLLYLFLVIFNRKKKNNIFNTNQASIFISLNRLDIDKINKDVFIQVLALSNSFILAITFAFAFSLFFDSFILNLILSFLILIVLIIVVYKLVGLFFRKKV